MIVTSQDDAELERLAEIRRKTQERKATRNNLEVVRIGQAPDADTSDERKYRTGLWGIDQRLGPLRPGQFTLLCAVSGMGKTVIAEQIAMANAAKGYAVMFATLEMTLPDIKLSIIARYLGLSLEETEQECREMSERYQRALEHLDELPLSLWRPEPRQPRTPEVILKTAAHAGAALLIVDYTRHVGGWEPGNTASRIVEQFSESVKSTGLHLVLLGQLKLDSHGKRPTPADVEDTKRLYQEADKVLFLHRPFFNRDEKRDTVSEIICSKNRRGKTFVGHVHWTGSVRSFYSMTPEEEARVACCQKRPAAKPKDIAAKIVQAQEKPVSFLDQMTAPQDETDEGYWPSERT